MSTTTSQSTLPTTCRGLFCQATGQPLVVQIIPTPTAQVGSAVVRILAASIDHVMPGQLAGQSSWMTLPTPFIPGPKAVGRIAAVGPDATTLTPGQLVLVEPFVRGRDNPSAQILWGLTDLGSKASKRLNAGDEVWRNGAFAEYVRVPLENCYALDERLLLGSPTDGGLGYTIAELTYIAQQLVGYGGLSGINVKPGETVIVAPATGAYGRAAVGVASAIGARVIAVGRNLDTLKKIAAIHPRVEVVQLRGSVEEDSAELQRLGPIDAYIDISPSSAADSTHVRTCIMALKPYGQVSLMGSIGSDIPISYAVAVFKNLTIRAQLMYEREHVRSLIKLIEMGVVKLGKSAGLEVVGQFPLEEWEKAMEVAGQSTEAGKIVVFTP